MFVKQAIICSRKTWMSLIVLTLGLTSTVALADSDPYSLARFQPVLDDSKLQAPDSSTARAQGDFFGFHDSFFRLDSRGKYLTFEMEGDSHRSELRQMNEWQTSSLTWQKMIGEVKLFYPQTSSLNQYTFMQIHDSGSYPNKPLIRLHWQRNRNDLPDHLWAVVRLSVSEKNYLWVNLGPRPGSFFKSEIKVKNNIMRVRINGITMLDMDVSYWDGLSNYFKAGVYLQDAGKAKVQFKSLKYYYE